MRDPVILDLRVKNSANQLQSELNLRHAQRHSRNSA